MRFFIRIGITGLALILSLLGSVINGSRSFQTSDSPEKDTLSIDEYWQLVESTSTSVASLKGMPVDVARAQLPGIANQWEIIGSIRLSDGTIVPVDSSFIVAQLRDEPPNLDHLDQLFQALLAEREKWPQEKFSPQDIQSLQRILAQPEFQWQSEHPSLLQIWWDKLIKRLEEFLQHIFGSSVFDVGSTILEYVLLGMGVLALILVLSYFTRGFRAYLVAETELNAADGSGEENLTADSALKKAEEMSSGGDYRQAVRYLYLSALLLLEERGLLRYDRSKTNREYLRSVSHIPELSGHLRQVVEVFDRVWYGFQSLDEETFLDYSNHVESLRQQK